MNSWWKPLQSRESARLSTFNSTEVRQPPHGGVSMFAATWPVPRIFCRARRTSSTSPARPPARCTCGEMPMSDSVWLRRITGSAGLSKP